MVGSDASVEVMWSEQAQDSGHSFTWFLRQVSEGEL